MRWPWKRGKPAPLSVVDPARFPGDSRQGSQPFDTVQGWKWSAGGTGSSGVVGGSSGAVQIVGAQGGGGNGGTVKVELVPAFTPPEPEDFIADRPRWERFWALIEAEDAARAADERESV